MSSINMERFQSYLCTLENDAQSWGQGEEGYEDIRRIAERNGNRYDKRRKYYYSLAEHLRYMDPENAEEIAPDSPVDNLKLGTTLLTNFAYIVAEKYSRDSGEANIDSLLQLFGKPATIATIAEPSFFTNDVNGKKRVSVAAMHVEQTMGILPLQDELEVEVAVQKYMITEEGVVFNDFPGYTSLRKEKSRCPANKFFGQMLGSIATICAKDPLLFQRTIDQNQRQEGIIIPVFS